MSRSERSPITWLFSVACLWTIAAGCNSKPVENSAKTPSASSPAAASPATPSPTTEVVRKEVTVAAASDLVFVLAEIIADFEKEHPTIRVLPTYGASGNFFAQLSNKAPFDLFLSADISYPRKLIEADLADKDSLFAYATGQIVIWVPNSSSLAVETLGIDVFKDPSIKKIAIANPKHAPYGRAAESALKGLGVYDEVADRLVMGENVAQTAQFVESGSADIGIIALSLVKAPTMKDKGRFWTIPKTAYQPLEQGGVIMNEAKERSAAEQFRTFVLGGRSREIFESYGFTVPAKE